MSVNKSISLLLLARLHSAPFILGYKFGIGLRSFFVILLFILEQFFDQNIKLLSECLNGILGILPQLFRVLNLCFEQLPQFLVIVLQLFTFERFPEDVFSVVS